MSRAARLLGLLAALISPVTGVGAAGAPPLEVVGSQFRISMPDGRVLTSSDLIGAVLDAADDAGRIATVRIEGVSRDPSDPHGDVWLHRFSVLDRETGSWREFCGPGPDGTVAGFPMQGVWTSDGRHQKAPSGFTITCTSGAIGKCVRLGYRPWGELNGQSLWDYHQACVRAVRADYGGDGVGHTRNGTLVDLADRLGIQTAAPDLHGAALTFEAAWGPNGALCVRKTRIPELLSLDELATRYPHLAGSIGPNCSETIDALVWNRS